MSPWIERIGAWGEWMGWLGLLFLPVELWRRKRRGTLTWESGKEMLASTAPLVPTLALGGVVIGFIVGLYSYAATLSPWQHETSALSACLCVLLVDFLYYWDHRAGHRIRWYWAVSHSVHHSSPQYDQTTALRISFVDGFLSPWFYLPAVLLGFHPLLVAASLGFILGYQQWIHTETIGTLGPLEGVVNTPSAHRVHHGAQPQYLDKNYGAVLLLWDRLFGTYQREEEPVRYGLTDPIPGRGPLEVHLCELRRLWRDLASAPSWGARLAMLWRGPEWRP